MYDYLDVQPPFITYTRHLGQKVYTINFNVEEVNESDSYECKFRYNTVTLPVGRYDRATVISAIIRQRYSDDEMQAIINNYLLDPNNSEAVVEFNEMQEYRKHAKNIADQFLQEIA